MARLCGTRFAKARRPLTGRRIWFFLAVLTHLVCLRLDGATGGSKAIEQTPLGSPSDAQKAVLVLTNISGAVLGIPSREAWESEFRYLSRVCHSMDLTQPGGRMTGMQTDVPETQWPFMQFCYLGFAAGNLAEARTAFRPRALEEMRWLIDAIQTPRLTGFITDHFGPPFGPGFKRPSVFVHGFFLNLVMRYRAVSGDDRYDSLARTIAAKLQEAFQLSPQGILPTYTNMWWMNDNLPALAALAACDRAFHQDTSAIRMRFLQSARTHYLDKHGLLSSYIDPGPKITLQVARGVSICYALHFLREIDSNFAKSQYAIASRVFFRESFGLAAVREFPEGEPTAFDVDSGPVVLGMGAAASGFAIGAAAVMQDQVTASKLVAASIVAGGPRFEADELSFATMPPVGQAVILFGKTELLRERTGSDTSDRRSPGTP